MNVRAGLKRFHLGGTGEAGLPQWSAIPQEEGLRWKSRARAEDTSQAAPLRLLPRNLASFFLVPFLPVLRLASVIQRSNRRTKCEYAAVTVCSHGALVGVPPTSVQLEKNSSSRV